MLVVLSIDDVIGQGAHGKRERADPTNDAFDHLQTSNPKWKASLTKIVDRCSVAERIKLSDIEDCQPNTPLDRTRKFRRNAGLVTVMSSIQRPCVMAWRFCLLCSFVTRKRTQVKKESIGGKAFYFRQVMLPESFH